MLGFTSRKTVASTRLNGALTKRDVTSVSYCIDLARCWALQSNPLKLQISSKSETRSCLVPLNDLPNQTQAPTLTCLGPLLPLPPSYILGVANPHVPITGLYTGGQLACSPFSVVGKQRGKAHILPLLRVMTSSGQKATCFLRRGPCPRCWHCTLRCRPATRVLSSEFIQLGNPTVSSPKNMRFLLLGTYSPIPSTSIRHTGREPPMPRRAHMGADGQDCSECSWKCLARKEAIFHFKGQTLLHLKGQSQNSNTANALPLPIQIRTLLIGSPGKSWRNLFCFSPIVCVADCFCTLLSLKLDLVSFTFCL